MRIIIIRTYGNRLYTLGKLQIVGKPFSCVTLERRPPENWKGMKNFAALPVGIYPLIGMMVPNTLQETLKVSVTGTFRKACFTNKSVQEMDAGSIQMGDGFSPKAGKLTNVKQKYEEFLELIEEQRMSGELPWQLKKGCAELMIMNSENFVYEDVGEEDDNNEDDYEFDD